MGCVCACVKRENPVQVERVVGGACVNDECKDEFGSGLVQLPEVFKA